MTRSRLFVAAALLAAGPLPSALAQPVPPMAQRPRTSPYLGLMAGFGNPGLNYLGVVRPQQQFQQQANLLSQQIRQNAQTLQDLNTALAYGIDPDRPMTGHGAVFNNTLHYFNSNPALGGGSGSGRVGGGVVGGASAFNTFGSVGGIGGGRGSIGNQFPAGMGGAAAARYGGIGRASRPTAPGGLR